MNLLEDHVDEPIKKVVVGLSLLGFNTIFSCCGFKYKNEKVVKSHLLRPYVYLDYTDMQPPKRCMLLDIMSKSLWTLRFLQPQLLEIKGECHPEGHPWSNVESPHNCEQALISIHRLEQMLDHAKEYFLSDVIIKDGNRLWKEKYKIKHWQYEECEDWIITKELYESL